MINTTSNEHSSMSLELYIVLVLKIQGNSLFPKVFIAIIFHAKINPFITVTVQLLIILRKTALSFTCQNCDHHLHRWG